MPWLAGSIGSQIRTGGQRNTIRDQLGLKVKCEFLRSGGAYLNRQRGAVILATAVLLAHGAYMHLGGCPRRFGARGSRTARTAGGKAAGNGNGVFRSE